MKSQSAYMYGLTLMPVRRRRMSRYLPLLCGAATLLMAAWLAF